ncbi:MAG: hypothetical protein ABIE70_01645 [bacterium]
MAENLGRSGLAIALSAFLGLLMCASPPKTDIFETDTLVPNFLRVAPDETIVADAYLFQARLWRDGKPTSIRLQIFDADTIRGVSGQGYLGKGAVKGFLRRDSLIVFFPSTKEYIIDDNLDWVWQAACTTTTTPPDIFSLLDRIPTAEDFEGVAFNDVGRIGNNHAIVATWIRCPWKLEMSYDMRDDSWRLHDFRFDFGDGNRLSAERNVYKHQTEVSVSKFYPDIRPGATRVIP